VGAGGVVVGLVGVVGYVGLVGVAGLVGVVGFVGVAGVLGVDGVGVVGGKDCWSGGFSMLLLFGGMVCMLVSAGIILVSPGIILVSPGIVLVSPGMIVVSDIPLLFPFMPECLVELQAAKNKPDNRITDPALKLVFMIFFYNMCRKHCARKRRPVRYGGTEY
jgi:hypothetical protein